MLLKLYLIIDPLLLIQQIISGRSRNWTANGGKEKQSNINNWVIQKVKAPREKKDINFNIVTAYEANLMLAHD